MIYKFGLVYDLDCTVGEAVAAYLDAEHYMFLHASYLPDYRVIAQDGFKLAIEQTWQGMIKLGNSCTTEYVPPARFLNYNLAPVPRWWPSIHHLVKTFTDLEYTPTPDGRGTVSTLRVDIDLPWFLWPLRHRFKDRLCKLKIEKDQEDVDMLHRHQQVYGRGNLSSYWRRDVFMLHKDAFADAFHRD